MLVCFVSNMCTVNVTQDKHVSDTLVLHQTPGRAQCQSTGKCSYAVVADAQERHTSASCEALEMRRCAHLLRAASRGNCLPARALGAIASALQVCASCQDLFTLIFYKSVMIYIKSSWKLLGLSCWAGVSS